MVTSLNDETRAPRGKLRERVRCGPVERSETGALPLPPFRGDVGWKRMTHVGILPAMGQAGDMTEGCAVSSGRSPSPKSLDRSAPRDARVIQWRRCLRQIHRHARRGLRPLAGISLTSLRVRRAVTRVAEAPSGSNTFGPQSQPTSGFSSPHYQSSLRGASTHSRFRAALKTLCW